MIVTGLHKSVF